jgi:hypothetical protein
LKAAAQERMKELETERERREKTNKKEVANQKEPRASTTDADVRVMKMSDGGWRPAYNMQIISTPEHQVIVAVDIDTSGSGRGLARKAPPSQKSARHRKSGMQMNESEH